MRGSLNRDKGHFSPEELSLFFHFFPFSSPALTLTHGKLRNLFTNPSP